MSLWERVWRTALNLIAMAFGSTEPGGAGAAGWWSWTISPDGVSWSCSNCVTIFTRTT
jgi:hypothetical protein